MVRHKILLVDDDPRILKIMGLVLKQEGHEVITATDGIGAIHATWAHLPSLILLDIKLPRKDGWEVLNELKHDPRTRHIPVVLLTAVDNISEMNKGVKMGSELYLTKPFSAEDLIAVVRHILEEEEKEKQSQ